MQALALSQTAADKDVPRIQRRPPGAGESPGGSPANAEPGPAPTQARAIAPWRACKEGGTTMTALAVRCGLSVTRLMRLIAASEQEMAKGKT